MMSAHDRLARILLTVACSAPIVGAFAQSPSEDPFAPLAVYEGDWAVRAEHPWSGATVGTVDQLRSRCHRFSLYFTCEQSVGGKPISLLVYTGGDVEGRLYTRNIAPDGRAGARGELTLSGSNWTYLDKPPPSLHGPWSRVENVIVDHDHIRFEEYESTDEGKTWKLVNSGEETRES